MVIIMEDLEEHEVAAALDEMARVRKTEKKETNAAKDERARNTDAADQLRVRVVASDKNRGGEDGWSGGKRSADMYISEDQQAQGTAKKCTERWGPS